MILRVYVKLVDNKGEKPLKDDKLTIANMPLTTLFRGATVELNKFKVSSVDFFHYKSYIQALCTYGNQGLHYNLETMGFHKDDTGNFDAVDSTNHGGWDRRNLFCVHTTTQDATAYEAFHGKEVCFQG